MNDHSFAMSRIGAAHVRRGLPCQDSSAAGRCGEYAFAVVSDGHGSRRHFRSDRGSAIACRVAGQRIRSFIADAGTAADPDASLIRLKEQICEDWTNAVTEDAKAEPWTEAELNEARENLNEAQYARLTSGEDAAIAYGATLCAAFTCVFGWAALQLGDGAFAHVRDDGAYEWPMPQSRVNQGNRTASLCMRDPTSDFRHCRGEDRPTGLLVYTDGIEKVFSPQSRELLSFLHWIHRNEYTEEPGRSANLAKTLDILTGKSAAGDDLSVAGVTDPTAQDVQPRIGEMHRGEALRRMEARLAELESAIGYNLQQLSQLRARGEGGSDAAEQINGIIRRNRARADALRNEIHTLRETIGLSRPPEADDAPDPEKSRFDEAPVEPAESDAAAPDRCEEASLFGETPGEPENADETAPEQYDEASLFGEAPGEPENADEAAPEQYDEASLFGETPGEPENADVADQNRREEASLFGEAPGGPEDADAWFLDGDGTQTRFFDLFEPIQSDAPAADKEPNGGFLKRLFPPRQKTGADARRNSRRSRKKDGGE